MCKPPAMIPVVAQDPLAPSALPTPDSWPWFTETCRTRAPSRRNEVTLRSVEMFTECKPGSFISPTPLLLVVALGDHLTVVDEALAAYERALEPKKLVMLSGGHFDAELELECRRRNDQPGRTTAASCGLGTRYRWTAKALRSGKQMEVTINEFGHVSAK
jgi:hypothetical protein